MLGRYRADIDGKINVGSTSVLAEVDVCAIPEQTAQWSVSCYRQWQAYHIGFSVSTYSLFNGATDEDVR